MYEFWYDYIIPKYGENARICYINAENFIVHAKTYDIYKVLQKMFKQDLTLQIMKKTDRYLREKI